MSLPISAPALSTDLPLRQPAAQLTAATEKSKATQKKASGSGEQLKDVFQQFVAGTFFQQMMQALRKTQGESPYLHGGSAETIFQGQMDQHLTDDMARLYGEPLVAPMFRAFQQQRQSVIDTAALNQTGDQPQRIKVRRLSPEDEALLMKPQESDKPPTSSNRRLSVSV